MDYTGKTWKVFGAWNAEVVDESQKLLQKWLDGEVKGVPVGEWEGVRWDDEDLEDFEDEDFEDYKDFNDDFEDYEDFNEDDIEDSFMRTRMKVEL